MFGSSGFSEESSRRKPSTQMFQVFSFTFFPHRCNYLKKWRSPINLNQRRVKKERRSTAEWLLYIKGPQIIRRSIKDKSGGAFSKQRRCGDLLRLKDGQEEVKAERGRQITASSINHTHWNVEPLRLHRFHCAERDESEAPALLFHLLLRSFITSSWEPN